MDRIEDRSFGVIALRKKGSVLETLIVYHNKGFWGFPKGHKEKNESDEEAALREFSEETGLQVTSIIPLETIEDEYIFTFNQKLISKSVRYFFAYATGQIKAQLEEVESAEWVPIVKLLDYFKFKNSQDFYKLLIARLEKGKLI